MKRPTIIVVVILIALVMAAFDCRMSVREYDVDAAEISESVRIALVTDLHSCRYGENQETLIDAVCAQNPDLILLGGDIFDDDIEDTNAELFLSGVAGRYPCYYVTGNHEYWSGAEKYAQKMEILRKCNVRFLSGECEALQVRGETINLCGVDDPDAFQFAQGESTFQKQINAVNEAVQNGNFTILLSHRPEYWEVYQKYDFDLVLCGHAHGGQWRIPGVLNGLFAPNQGLFPEYAGGRYDQDGRTMIVSRGLARESTRVPRIFNRPELVMIDIY